MTIDFVKQKLLDEFQRRIERSGASNEKVMKAKDKKNKVCFQCQKPCHFKAQCRLLKQQQQQQNAKSDSKEVKRESKAKQAAEKDSPVCFTVGEYTKGGCWYIDSGLSTHMTSERSFFVKLDRNVKTEVVLADGSVTKACGIGEGTVRCPDGDGKVKDTTISEVLYIPALNSGLISVRKLAQKGFEVKFSATECQIKSGSGSVVATGVTSGNLYLLKTAEHAKLGKVMQHLKNCQHTWHRRMGHRDPAVLERAKELSEGVDVQDCGIIQVCEPCLQGKLPRNSFPKASSHRSSCVLDLIHTDVCGPMANVTPGGCRYILTMTDDFSRYCVVFLLRQKSDVAGCIKRYVAHCKTRFGRPPCIIRSDGGGEFINRELKDFYDLEGIQSQVTAPYSPQQNGIAERKNRTLQKMASCMLLDAGLAKKYWVINK